MPQADVTPVKHVEVFSLLKPNNNIDINLNGQIVKAAIFAYVYTATGPRRVKPSQEPEKSMYAALRAWKGVTVPKYVVVREAAAGALVVEWDGKQTRQGPAPWKRPIAGKLTTSSAGVWAVDLDPNYTFPVEPSPEPEPEVAVRVDEAPASVPVPPEPTPAPVKADTQFIPVIEEPVEMPEPEPGAPYTGDPIAVDAVTGHFIGDDGFRAPKDFDEFYTRFPFYIRNWVTRRLGRYATGDDVEDWCQELVLHLKYLPANSKHRDAGCRDVIETFNPYRQYGASERRFRYYVNCILSNKFNTLQSKRQKNPICRTGNVPYGAHVSLPEQTNAAGSGAAPDDEYVHAHSDHLIRAAARTQKQHDDHLFTLEFIDFVGKKDPTVLPAIDAIKQTGTQSEAARFIGVDDQEFNRLRNRLRVLAECFKTGTEVPKARKPYKRRGEPVPETPVSD
jgi:hypothetical protein